MGSLESRLPLKREHHLQRSSSVRNNSNNNNAHGFWGQRNRSRFARLLLFKKINYLQLICSAAVFFFFVFLFQMLLPGHVMDDIRKSDRIHDLFRKNGEGNFGDMSFLKDLDFGEDVKFEPMKILAKFQKDAKEVNESVASRKIIRFGYKKPKLALVFADLWVDPHQILMVTVATALREIGYEIEVFSLENGPVHAIWTEVGFPLRVITADENMKFSVDWLNYNGILVNSLKAVGILSSLMQEPFRNVPLVWTIHEQTLAVRLRQYVSDSQTELIENWRKVFSRAAVIVFPNYILPIAYSACDPGNYFVIPGSPAEAWKANKLVASNEDNLRLKMNYGPDDFVIAIVGSQLLYRGLWLEHAIVLQALHPVLRDFSSSSSRLKIVVLAGDFTSNYSIAVETVARNLKYPNGTVKHAAVDEDADTILRTADLVIYGSFLEEHTFPESLLKAMCFEKPIIAPDLPMIREHVSDRVNGYLFPKKYIGVLTEIVFQLISNGKLSPLARNVASIGKRTAKNLMVSESVEGYASLLENVLVLPSEVAVPWGAKEIPMELKSQWQWHHFEALADAPSGNKTGRIHKLLDKVEKQLNRTHKENSMALVTSNETFFYSIWEEQKYVDMVNMRKRREDEELKDRTDQPRGSWDEIYKNARRVDRSLHERDEGELERTGQPLCIYEPYLGEGTWPFLHSTSLYRGLGLSAKGRRPEADDIDAPSRLPILNNAYYREVLGEYGAFFAIANRIDRIHKNAWIGFQSWRATAMMKSLSKTAERSLLNAIEAKRHGDALYFWARLDMDPRNQVHQDFWSFCDAINAGNCQFAFSEALRKMYGVKQNLSSLPPMPSDQGTWSVMNCWALPTKSFTEFVMFSRMFVDALDAHFYDEHQKTGRCYLSFSKDKHCYSRMLELLVNVWAYHSARRMVYLNPETGLMQEQHKLNTRRGRMWIKWFQFTTLKSMDEDLAEEFDSEHPKRRRLWPSTGEIFWHGIYEKERNIRNKEKERKRQQSKDKIQRMRRRSRQKALGKYVKPVEEELNSTTIKSRLSR
ncbi:hypothetical protein CDL12_00683 [Handroanthus impetiginosus]|uniref:Glycosyl transferase family 1 domain-containing protein n=1 Tax=Handroanthus impetiginosus TaxID=429701 RepID=A0A2G9I9W7_9LAMI|nr:hypothetical protein CDL12_00683 [Handroanthus impetiginosus]